MINCVLGQPYCAVVFAGISGAGKSTAANFFLNGEYFECGLLVTPVTKECSAATSTICGKTVKIVDTPGCCNPGNTDEEVLQELNRSLSLAKDGIHAVAFVINSSCYTEDYEKAITQLLHFKPLIPFVFVLLTHAGDEGGTKAKTDEYIQQLLLHPNFPAYFKNLIQLVDNRVIMVESLNITEQYHVQKSEEFMAMIKHTHQSNGYTVYEDALDVLTLEDAEEPTGKQSCNLPFNCVLHKGVVISVDFNWGEP